MYRAYAYDPIGNRRTAGEGWPLVATTYTRNGLNQYDRADTASSPPVGQGYRYDADGNLVEAYVAADMNCDGVLNAFDINPFILALTAAPPDYHEYYDVYPTCDRLNGDMDGDGDLDAFDADLFSSYLSGHGRATGLRVEYTWDAENRLVGVDPADDVPPTEGLTRVDFGYDYLGRRVWKQAETYQSGQWSVTEQRKFVWSGWPLTPPAPPRGADHAAVPERRSGGGVKGWLMLMELDGSNNVVRKYTWGLDLAGQSGDVASGVPAGRLDGLESAGGIAGLLSVYDTNGPGPSDDLEYVYTYDANGNVGQVIDWVAADAASAIKARYEYDPYGNVTAQSGTYADGTEPDNPFTFSTKYFDSQTGLGSWGYRYYSPRNGRWLNRDPLGESGAANLYEYVLNNPPALMDPFGQAPIWQQSDLNLVTTDTACCHYSEIRVPVESDIWHTEYAEQGGMAKTEQCPKGTKSPLECCKCSCTDYVNGLWALRTLKRAEWGRCCTCTVEQRAQVRKRFNPSPGSIVDGIIVAFMDVLQGWHTALLIECPDGSRWFLDHAGASGKPVTDHVEANPNPAHYWTTGYPILQGKWCVSCDAVRDLVRKAAWLDGTIYSDATDCYWFADQLKRQIAQSERSDDGCAPLDSQQRIAP